MKKTINIKIPVDIYTKLVDNGQLNPQYINEWLENQLGNVPIDYTIDYSCLTGHIGVTYTFKASCSLIAKMSAISVLNARPITVIGYYLFNRYYRNEVLNGTQSVS